jgi:hypothetical protein
MYLNAGKALAPGFTPGGFGEENAWESFGD